MRIPAVLAFLLTALAAAHAESGRGFWKPHSDVTYGPARVTTYRGPITYDPTKDLSYNFSNSWVQQLRNLRDVLLVDRYREPDPTPTPTPSQGDGTFKIDIVGFKPGEFDPRPPHPLADYFSDVADIYADRGFSNIARPLRKAGRVLEDLILGRGPQRFRAARSLARELQASVADSSDDPAIEEYSLASEPQATVTTRWDNHRAIAAGLAKSLRAAARNAAANRPLTRSLPYLRKDVVFVLSQTGYGYNGYLTILTRTDGRGGAKETILSQPTAGSASSGSNSSGSNSSGSYTGGSTFSGATLSSVSILSGVTFVWNISETPTPTPTPDP
jgi:hypothetical protein